MKIIKLISAIQSKLYFLRCRLVIRKALKKNKFLPAYNELNIDDLNVIISSINTRNGPREIIDSFDFTSGDMSFHFYIKENEKHTEVILGKLALYQLLINKIPYNYLD